MVPEDSGVDTAAGYAELADKIGRLESVRHICRNLKIPIPGVVVVGEQSAGKSSVLENISGIQFPRAQNTCTRMPCVVQLAVEHSAKDPYALVSMDPGFSDAQKISVEAVQERIRVLTEEHAMGHCYISTRAINVKVVRASGPALSLIDLPGVTHNAGGMANVHEVTVELVREYVRPEEVIILCVLPATSDFSNAEVIRLAREADPKGVRTLGVITKCDDAAATEASDIVEKATMARTSDVRLTLGFHCVVNRSQRSVDRSVSREELRQRERQLFQENPRLRGLPTDCWGTARLVEKLARLQSAHVDECLPAVHEAVRDRLAGVRKELSELPAQLESEGEQNRFFNSVLRGLCADFERRLRAEFVSSDAAQRALAVAPRVADLVRDFRDALRRENPQWASREMIEDVRGKIRDFAHGYTVGNLAGPAVFTSLIRWKFVEGGALAGAVEVLTDSIGDLLCSVLAQLAQKHATPHHPVLAGRIIEIGREAVLHQCEIARKHCRALADAQVVTSTTSGDYMARLSTFRKCTVEGKGPQLGLPQEFVELAKKAARESPEELQVLETCASLQHYTEHMLDGFIEMSAKLVQHNMVFRLMEELEERCRTLSGSVAGLFPLDPYTARRRADLEQQVQQLSGMWDMLAKLHSSGPPRKRIHKKA